MNPYSGKDEKLRLFRSLFRGREDVFAIRWEKGKKNGYMPACQYDPYMYRLHKRKGGTLGDYEDKTYLPLTDHQLLKHFKGEQLIGIYPLLQDNTSWFIAADFDKANWAEECRKFIHLCKVNGIPAYLERSRSGKGGHVWIFFDQSYPAIKSRKIMINLLEQSGVFSRFDKSSSFDRLFPNQDYHKGKGFGNLIALPLHKPALEHGNCCFVDDELHPHENQWKLLASCQRVPVSHLNKIYDSLQPIRVPASPIASSGKLHIKLNNAAHLNRAGISQGLIHFLKESLNFANAEFFIKKQSGRNTWGTKSYFRFITETVYSPIRK